jgi:hypothetical protein
MYLPHRVEVRSIGEDVEVAIGSLSRRMFFETAVLLAVWIDECARDAKAWRGRSSNRRFYAIGTLHDASNPNWINEGQPNDPLRVFNVNRDLLKKEQIAVRQEGARVVVKAGATEASMPYQAALQIAQWIRLHAKQSQKRAGDVDRHWSKIKQAHEQASGPRVTRG